MKADDMNNERFVNRTVCKRDVTFLVGERTYSGAIENMSNYGARILVDTSGCVQKGMKIRLAISCDDQEEARDASVVWSEKGVFGAKFI
jgi:DNA-binding transcriptional MocR family regulator